MFRDADSSARASAVLTAQSEFFDQLAVALGVLSAQVCQQAASTTDKLEQRAAASVVCFVDFQMLGQVADTVCKECDLHFW